MTLPRKAGLPPTGRCFRWSGQLRNAFVLLLVLVAGTRRHDLDITLGLERDQRVLRRPGTVIAGDKRERELTGTPLLRLVVVTKGPLADKVQISLADEKGLR